MSDNPARPIGLTLLGTDDAMVWAEEFCRIFAGKIVVMDEINSGQNSPVDPGLMVGWFANAMQTAVTLYLERQKMEVSEVIQVLNEPPGPDIDYAPQFDEGEEDDRFRVRDEEKDAFVEGFTEGRPPQ